jgi:CheY-like chemotaxis protein
VEDNPRDIELTLAAIQGSGIENPVIVLRNGAEALDYLAKQLANDVEADRPARNSARRYGTSSCSGLDTIGRVPKA